MPFKSQAQSNAAFGGYLGPEMKAKAKEWADKTDYKSLPDKVSEGEDDKKDYEGFASAKAKEDWLKGKNGQSDKGISGFQKKTQTEERMTTISKLLEAIREKRWHDATTLFSEEMQTRMADRIDDIKTRVYSEDTKKCELCGSTKNVKMVDDTPLCAKCDPESDLDECPEDTVGGVDKDMKKSPFNKNIGEDDELNSVEKGDQAGGGAGPVNEARRMLKETGEWNDAEGKGWMDALKAACKEVQSEVPAFKFVSVKGFDMYQGPVAAVTFKGKNYKVWMQEDDILWIDGFPVDNTSGPGKRPGFEGTVSDVIDACDTGAQD